MTIVVWIAVAGWVAALAAGAAYVVTRRRSRARQANEASSPASAAQMRMLIASTARRRRQTSQAAPVTDLRSDVAAQHEDRESEVDTAHLIAELVDIRDACGADEAVFWRWDEARDSLTPMTWSTEGADRPRHFHLDDWGPLARWAAEEAMVILDAGDESTPPIFAAAPIMEDALLVGVLTVSRVGGLRLSRQNAKQWLPRHAEQLARLISLTDARREYARQMRQSRALLSAMRQVQTNGTQESLSAAICDTALEVSSGSAAALVRWRADMQKGAVRHTTSESHRHAPFALDADTLAFNACRDAMIMFIEDTSRVDAAVSLFEANDTGWRTGSLGIVPLIRGDVVIGAIVVTSPEPARITQDEVHNLSLLGAMACASLEIAWEIDAVTKRASTDGLTGLVNRRAFDEHLKRLLNETERFGQPLALLLADIDHFKKINDTWGHEAGDEVLRRVARKLTEGVRTVDVCARYGGEEIAILLPQTALAGATDLADRLRHAVGATPVKFKGEEIAVTVSLGVASYPDSVRQRDGLFRAADRALYEAKRAGRNCVKAVAVENSG